jgi:hypothetical protein
MAIEPNSSLLRFIHDVNSKCSSLKTAAALLKGGQSAAELELLALMKDQAHSLAAALSRYEAQEREKIRK